MLILIQVQRSSSSPDEAAYSASVVAVFRKILSSVLLVYYDNNMQTMIVQCTSCHACELNYESESLGENREISELSSTVPGTVDETFLLPVAGSCIRIFHRTFPILKIS